KPNWSPLACDALPGGLHFRSGVQMHDTDSPASRTRRAAPTSSSRDSASTLRPSMTRRSTMPMPSARAKASPSSSDGDTSSVIRQSVRSERCMGLLKLRRRTEALNLGIEEQSSRSSAAPAVAAPDLCTIARQAPAGIPLRNNQAQLHLYPGTFLAG